MAASGLLAAWLHLRLAAQPDRPIVVRVLWAVAGNSLAVGIVLAALYGARAFGGLGWLDIPTMRAWHGTADALGFALAGMVGWNLVRDKVTGA